MIQKFGTDFWLKTLPLDTIIFIDRFNNKYQLSHKELNRRNSKSYYL